MLKYLSFSENIFEYFVILASKVLNIFHFLRIFFVAFYSTALEILTLINMQLSNHFFRLHFLLSATIVIAKCVKAFSVVQRTLSHFLPLF